MFYNRIIQNALLKEIEKPWVHIFFGARQTGKTTLLRRILPAISREYDFADPSLRSAHLADPGLFIRECEALPDQGRPHVIFADEVQSVPHLFDSIQFLFDKNKTRWRFVVCGSSARKLRKLGTNLLPGRSILHRLYPLTLFERPGPDMVPGTVVPSPADPPAQPDMFPAADIEERLMYGSLPGIALADPQDRAALLQSYAVIHLEEEIRRENSIRDWGAFINFLRFSALSSGKQVQYSTIARETGISIPTVRAHYELLQDMFVGFSVPAFARSEKKQLILSPRFFFFDLGVRHAAARQNPSADLIANCCGDFFEQWVGIELWKRLRYLNRESLYYLRHKNGMEIDFIVDLGDEVIPIEVKWTQRPVEHDARHLNAFMKQYPDTRRGYVVCRCRNPQRLSEKVTAIPWQTM